MRSASSSYVADCSSGLHQMLAHFRNQMRVHLVLAGVAAIVAVTALAAPSLFLGFLPVEVYRFVPVVALAVVAACPVVAYVAYRSRATYRSMRRLRIELTTAGVEYETALGRHRIPWSAIRRLEFRGEKYLIVVTTHRTGPVRHLLLPLAGLINPAEFITAARHIGDPNLKVI